MKNDSNKIKEPVEEILGEEKDKCHCGNCSEKKELKQKIADYENNYRRALADYQNLQKRSMEDRQNWLLNSNKDLLLRLLPIMDTLILADKHKNDKEIKIILDQFEDTLKSEGVLRIKALDQKFDPQLMEAVEVVEGEDDKVIEEVRSGFILNDKLLRAAQVKVGKKSLQPAIDKN